MSDCEYNRNCYYYLLKLPASLMVTIHQNLIKLYNKEKQMLFYLKTFVKNLVTKECDFLILLIEILKYKTKIIFSVMVSTRVHLGKYKNENVVCFIKNSPDYSKKLSPFLCLHRYSYEDLGHVTLYVNFWEFMTSEGMFECVIPWRRCRKFLYILVQFNVFTFKILNINKISKCYKCL